MGVSFEDIEIVLYFFENVWILGVVCSDECYAVVIVVFLGVVNI